MHKTLPFFIENFIEYIYIFIYVYIYIYLIFFVFTNEDQYILYCIASPFPYCSFRVSVCWVEIY